MSNKHLVLVLTEPTAGQEQAFNDYYENVHLDEVIETTGWHLAQRYRLAAQVGESCPLPYLALYEAQADSAEAVLEQLHSTRAQRQQSQSLNRKTARVWVFEPTGTVHLRPATSD